MAFSGWYPSSYIRMPYSGIANNNVIWPWHVGDLYYEVSGIEKILGFNPLNGYPSLTERISGIELRDSIDAPSSTVNNSLVSWSGSTGGGLLSSSILLSANTMSGLSGLHPMSNGTADIGSTTNIFATGYFSCIVPTFVLPLTSNASFVGSRARTFKTGYFDGIMLNGITLVPGISSLSGISGVIGPVTTTLNGLSTWGDATGATLLNNRVTLSLNILSGLSGILPGQSGVNNVGSSSMVFSTGYFNDTRTAQINGGVVTRVQFMEEPIGLVNGLNSGYTLTRAPYGNSLTLFKNGQLMLMSGVHSTTADYLLQSNSITFYTAPASGSTLIAQSYSYLV
jgi:hypothetical protein